MGRKTGSDGYIFNLAILIGNNVEEYSAYVVLNASTEVERLTALRKLCDSSVVVNDRLSICCEFSGGVNILWIHNTKYHYYPWQN